MVGGRETIIRRNQLVEEKATAKNECIEEREGDGTTMTTVRVHSGDSFWDGDTRR